MNKTDCTKSVAAWNELMENICGDSIELRTAVYNKIMDGEEISREAKDWLRKISKI
ncbi:hypothetical protein [Legionella sp. WA2024007413]